MVILGCVRNAKVALKHSNEQSLEPKSFPKDENAARTGWIRTVGRAVVRQGNADN